MNCHATNLFIGKPGSGKTSLVVSLFKSKDIFKKVFHNIYLFQPSQSRSSMEDDIFESIPNNMMNSHMKI
jgi:AAA15 family ATPase/GTPase